jgi:uncharacterized membrane protein
MPATAPKTSPASRLIASGTKLRDDQRYALADLICVLRAAYSDLPAEAQTAYRNAILLLENGTIG